MEVYISNYYFSVLVLATPLKVAKYKVTINLHNMIHECSLFERGPTYVMYGRCSVVVGKIQNDIDIFSCG